MKVCRYTDVKQSRLWTDNYGFVSASGKPGLWLAEDGYM